MKVLWLSHLVPFPPTGGAMQRAYHLLHHAASHHEVHLLAFHQPRLLPSATDLSESITALSLLCASVRVCPIPAEQSRFQRARAAARSILGGSPFDAAWLSSDAMRLAVAQADPADLVHVDTVGLWPYVEHLRNTALVLNHHNIESHLGAQRAAHEGNVAKAIVLRRDASKLRQLEMRASHEASVNIVVSPLDATRLQAIVPTAALEVVPNGVDAEYWQPGAAEGCGMVFVGTLGWYANRDAVQYLLADIWPALLSTRPRRRLVIVGRDPPAGALAAASDPRIHVTGFVPDIRPYLRDAAIYVCPLRLGGGTRLKVLDGLAMGKALVSTALGVEGLDLVDGLHYLRAESAADFVAQVDRLEDDPDLRHALGRAGRQEVMRRFDWRLVTRRLDAAYARAASAETSTTRNRLPSPPPVE